jgi:hypothetical protein
MMDASHSFGHQFKEKAKGSSVCLIAKFSSESSANKFNPRKKWV